MDEYLFIAMAKLKADRLRLEREQLVRLQVAELAEQRAQAPADEPRKQPVENQRTVRTSWFSRAPQWRAQS